MITFMFLESRLVLKQELLLGSDRSLESASLQEEKSIIVQRVTASCCLVGIKNTRYYISHNATDSVFNSALNSANNAHLLC